ncbi:MAG: 2-oxoacid:ferredoxin oxidoreductase subunit beta [Chloroflexi bacterium]|nr:2-oxoacid:ferredoxin oxidoreductase subunit beta [Chloroflexota bacterium]MCI0580902.1 2-oxoacid:ferredoxin oxidoreductase subunit beta [Chloroflexota bacterium]MCI0649750.1 2-oxoacid:ferredoxin oxidoreductase subunit beta [Chloroflexota bacterium]MCI0725489.1 2-oxoacid:ferredoxin oxidoreductase subunit beta [Chloroflexota bacterium]
MTARPAERSNAIGLEYADYKGRPSTLCKGCGHDSITSQIITVAYELSLKPHQLIKLSGIGCSSKSPAYFLGRSHGFNALHGRMPSVGTGALVANHHLIALGVSGDGDTASIGLGQFKHLMRRNVRLVYVVENNGVYGLTKGQFSATADEGLELKYAGKNFFPAEDLCLEAIIAGCGFVARSFSGDPKQVRELLKAALSHRGTALLDIISPCVTFNNRDDSPKSYGWGKEHEDPLHDISFIPAGFVPKQEEILIEEYEPGEVKEVTLHDGSIIRLRKLDEDYDPTDRMGALHRLEWARQNKEFITGLIYFDDSRPSLAEVSNLGETPLAYLPEEKLRPSPEKLEEVMKALF